MPSQDADLTREVDVLRRALKLVQERLPRGWRLEREPESSRGDGGRVDARIELTAPGGGRATLLAEVKRVVVTRDLPSLLDQLRTLAEREPRPTAPLVIARYLAPSTQKWLTENDVPYADATGNIRIALDTPSLFLRDVGASKDPWRGPGRPRGTLKGEPPARVVRALVDFTLPFSVPQLVELSGASTGATYRVVDFLQEEALIDRSSKGLIESVRWRQLLERWSMDYGFMASNPVFRCLQPRGLPSLMKSLTTVRDVRYAVTGSIAAQTWAPYAPPRAAMIYTDNMDGLLQRIDLRIVDSGANVLVAASKYDVVFERAQVLDGVNIVAPSQAVVDLMTGPGRNPSEAETLLEWMEQNVDSWRR